MEGGSADVILHASRLAERAVPRVGPEQILHPRSVAVFGASDSKDKFGGRIMHFLIRHGFAGELYPINPRRSEVLGRPAYPSIKDAPSPADEAILALPGSAIVQAVGEAADAGVGCCVIITTGFAEAGAQGIAWQAALVDVARRTGIRIVGPNCMGLVVPHHRLALCSSVVLDTDQLRDGPIGLVSQSGALMVSIYDRAATDGIGFRHCVSLGNQSDLELCDFIEYMVGDPATEAICVYGEAAQAADTRVMITLTPGAAANAPRQALRDIGQFYFDRFEDALRVVALVAEHDTLRALPPSVASRPAGLPDAAGLAGLLVGQRGVEGPVKSLLGAYGVRLVREGGGRRRRRRRRRPSASGFLSC